MRSNVYVRFAWGIYLLFAKIKKKHFFEKKFLKSVDEA